MIVYMDELGLETITINRSMTEDFDNFNDTQVNESIAFYD